MKISKIRRIREPLQLYDVVDAGTDHNFIITTKSNKFIVSHNSSSSSVHIEQNKVMLTYNNIYERIASRFTRDGTNWGTMFLVSSKKSEYDFLESYIRKQKEV